MSDVVEIRGLRVMGTHGVLEEERQRAQPFEVDIDVETDLAAAGATGRGDHGGSHHALAVTRAFLGLGSNLGDRRAHLRAAVAALPDVVAISDVYETDPVGGPEQGPYLNLVVELDTELTPHQLLEVAHELEAAGGRIRAE